MFIFYECEFITISKMVYSSVLALRCCEVCKDNKHSKEDSTTSVDELNPLFFNWAVTSVESLHVLQVYKLQISDNKPKLKCSF